MTGFVGRESELAVLERHVEAERLVSVLGPPGAGKTALVRRWLEVTQRRACFCDLAPARSAEQMLVIVRGAIGAPAGSGGDWESHAGSLAPALEDAGVVVLDNLEHLTDEAAPWIAKWLASARGTRFVVTSREPLRLAGEVRLGLGALPEELGVELFIARARAVAGDAALSAQEREAVAVVVRRLDSLPLAIELAAARSGVLGPAEIAARLDKPFELLTRAGRRHGGRFGSLEDAIAWSWGMLSPFEQRALAGCAVFAGSFTVTAAEAVLDLGPDAPRVLDVVQSLVERSLLQIRPGRPGTERRVALYESVRELVASRSEAGAAALRRHAEFVTRAAEAAADGLDRGAEGSFSSDLAELHADLCLVMRRFAEAEPVRAARSALAIVAGMIHAGPYDEAVRLAEQARAWAAVDDELAARAELLLGEAHRRAGALALALEHARAARARAGSSAGPVAARSLLLEATMRRDLGEYEEAFACGDACVEAARELGDALVGARADLVLATVLLQLQDPDAAERVAPPLAVARACSSPLDEALALFVSGLCAHDVGDLDAACTRYEEALEIARRIGERRAEALITMSAALVPAACGDLEGACRQTEEAGAIVDRIGDRRARAVTDGYLAVFVALAGDAAKSDAWIGRARARLSPLAGPVIEGFVGLCAASGDLARAEAAVAEGAHVRAERWLARVHEAIALASLPRLAPAAEPGEQGPGAREASLPLADRSIDARFVLRLLQPRVRDLSRALGEPIPPSSMSPRLEVEPSGRWFRLRHGQRTGLANRPVLASVLRVLALERELRPGRGVDADALFAAAWSGERAVAKARAARVYVAISSLRKLGLGPLLLRTHEGYLLDPEVPLDRPA